MTKDLTQGSPFKLILMFALPTMIGMLFQQFYSLVDTMIVGNLLGPQALASVGSTASVQFVVLGFCMGICSGFAIPVAQRLGAGDHSRMRNYIWNGAYLAIGSAIVLAVVTGLLANQILTVMDTPSDIYEGAYAYIIVIFVGIPSCFLYNMPASIMRSLGDSKTPVYFLIMASILNIVLDIVLITQVGMGVAGAAVATVISQGLSGIACLVVLARKFPILKSSADEREFSVVSCQRLCAMGIPMGLQYSITGLGSIILQSAVNGLGSAVVSATTLGQKVCTLFYVPFDALGATMATYSGQNVGAMKLDRLGKGIRSASMIGFVYSIVAGIVLSLFAPQLCLLFLSGSETYIIDLATQLIRMTSIFLFPLALIMVTRFAMQGMGFGKFAIIAGVFEMVTRAIFGFVLVPSFGYLAVMLSSPAAWIMADVFLLPGVAWCIRNLRKQHGLPVGSCS